MDLKARLQGDVEVASTLSRIGLKFTSTPHGLIVVTEVSALG